MRDAGHGLFMKATRNGAAGPASTATPAVVTYRDDGDDRVFAAAMAAQKMTARVVL